MTPDNYFHDFYEKRGTHIVAKALIFNDRGEILVLYRAPWIGKHPKPRYYIEHAADAVGGAVGDGYYHRDETAREATAREITEESGLNIPETKLRLAYAETRITPDEKSVTCLCYIAKLDDKPEIKISWEHENFAWVKPETAIEDDIFGEKFFGDALEYIMKHRALFEN